MRIEKAVFSAWRAVRSFAFKVRETSVKKSPELLRSDQEARFAGIGLSRPEAIRLVDNRTDRNERYREETSEHYRLFAAIASSGFAPERILEIGTFEGRFARFLSIIFPLAIIHTVDLPESEGLAESYGRNRWSDYRSVRQSNLDVSSNVTLFERNSLSLTHHVSNYYDLVWVDGDHGYPIATADIVNSLRLLRPGGILCVDDVHKEVVDPDETLRSLAAFQTLSALDDTGLVESLSLVLKRLSPGKNLPWTEKFVAYARKPWRSEEFSLDTVPTRR